MTETPIPGPGPRLRRGDTTPTNGIPETAQDDSDTFDREYVTGLREEAKSWRLKAAKSTSYRRDCTLRSRKPMGAWRTGEIFRSTRPTSRTRKRTRPR